jgi:hypothetical protein
MKEDKKMSTDKAFTEVETYLKTIVKGRYGGLVIVDESKKTISHFINDIQTITLRNNDTELWMNNQLRAKLMYNSSKVSADFYFKVIMDIFNNQIDEEVK